MLDRIRDSFTPDDARAEALLAEACNYIDRVHGVGGRALYTFGYGELPGIGNASHLQADFVIINTKAERPVLATVQGNDFDQIDVSIEGVFNKLGWLS